VQERSVIAKYSIVAALFFLSGLVFSMTGILFVMVAKITRFSDPEMILAPCLLIGLGLVLTLVGVNFLQLRQNLKRNISFTGGILLSLIGLAIFASSYPDAWLYPVVSYAIISYSLGIFLLMLNIFVNYSFKGRSYCNKQEHLNDSDLPSYRNETEQTNRSVPATFASILMANLLPDYSSSFSTGLAEDENIEFMANTAILEDNEETAKSSHMKIKPDDVSFTEVKIISQNVHAGEEETAHEDIQFSSTATLIEKEEPESIPGDTIPEEIVVVTDTAELTETVLSAVSKEAAEAKEDSYNEEKTAEIVSSAKESTSKEPRGPFDRFLSIKKTNIKADDTMRAAARKILMFHFGRMLEHERETKVGKDIEELHDMRVAAMRMRSVIEVLEGYLDTKSIKPYYKDIKSIRRTLGNVRDLDVFLEKIDHYVVDQGTEMLHEMDPLTDSILIERAKNRGSMLMYLDDKRYNKFKQNFASYLEKKSFWKIKSVKKNGDPIPCRVKDILPVLLYTQFAAVRAYDELISGEDTVDPSLKKYHELRIDVKILRYTLEFFKEVLGPESRDVIKDLKSLQDNLGDMHDTVVALEILENFERTGKWGDAGKKKNKSCNGILEYPGVDAYLEYRKRELESLLETFPSAWAKVIDANFSVRFSQAISGIYR